MEQTKTRREPDPPIAADEWGWRYHHMGIPTTEKKPGERYIPHLKMYVSGFEQPGCFMKVRESGTLWLSGLKDRPKRHSGDYVLRRILQNATPQWV